MKNPYSALLVSLCLPGVSFAAVTFTDSTGENFDNNAHMDITSVVVDSTPTTISFTVNIAGTIVAGDTDWGKYLVGISTGDATGDTSDPVANPWGRNIRMDDGIDAWVGSWVDGGGGAQASTFDGTGWNQNNQVVPIINASSTSFTFALADLGLSPNQTFQFDVYSSGGGAGDSANDAVANPGETVNDWQVPYSTPSTGTGAALSYTVVPEPAVALLGGLGLLGLLRRRR